MKAEIEKIIEDIYFGWAGDNVKDYDFEIDKATSSLTALIIKWLEGKKLEYEDRYAITDKTSKHFIQDCKRVNLKVFVTNQLITELIGEVR